MLILTILIFAVPKLATQLLDSLKFLTYDICYTSIARILQHFDISRSLSNYSFDNQLTPDKDDWVQTFTE